MDLKYLIENGQNNISYGGYGTYGYSWRKISYYSSVQLFLTFMEHNLSINIFTTSSKSM